jgi:uncharacterized protein YbbC (DUF1343 family)
MQLGIDILLRDQLNLLKGKRVGILAHEASRDSQGRYTVDLIKKIADVTTLFGPEHGLDSVAQDMEPVSSIHHQSPSTIPIYSLYGDSFESLSPTPSMLENVDVLVIDLQDIGTRYYTYVWTMLLCMRVCAKLRKEMIVCDRPNPLGGTVTEGPLINAGFESFVGLSSIPVRHGMTIGELAKLLNRRENLHCKLTVIEMQGWERTMHFPDTGLQWVNPSPNMRSYHAALVYPGMCLLEATNVSEGRGTERPFEYVGAPFIDAEELREVFLSEKLPGVTAKTISFTPTMQKWEGDLCQGLEWQVTDVDAFKPYKTGLAFIACLYTLYQDKGFAWRTEPYEFVSDIPAIDLLTGSDTFRKQLGA